MKHTGGTAACLAGLAIFGAAMPAYAEETPAERLFKEGRAAMLSGDFATACPKLAESQRLDPHTGTLLNLAACHEREGKVGAAWVEYQKALTAARAEGQAERARLAEQRIAALDPRVPWLRIVVPEGREAPAVTLDGGEVARVALGTEMPVDPGLHVVSAGGHEQRIDLREGERRTISLEGIAAAPPAPERLVVEQPPPQEKPREPEPPRGRFIFHFGAMGGLGFGNHEHPRPTSGASSSVVSVDRITGNATSQPRVCDGSCTYGTSKVSAPGFAFHFYAGYALSDSIDVGPRIAGLLSNDVTVWAFGPSVSFHAGERLNVGFFALFGDATLNGFATPSVSGDYRFVTQSRDPVAGSLGGGLGLGVSASYRLYRLAERSELTIDSTPFFLSGSQGNAFVIPIGIGFRYQ